MVQSNDSYTQLDEVKYLATQVALSYDKCQEIVRNKSSASGNDGNNHYDFSVLIEGIQLFPGRREVLLKILFSDGDGLQVFLDVDNRIVHWVKNYW